MAAPLDLPITFTKTREYRPVYLKPINNHIHMANLGQSQLDQQHNLDWVENLANTRQNTQEKCLDSNPQPSCYGYDKASHTAPVTT